jgi:hypothetical protein
MAMPGGGAGAYPAVRVASQWRRHAAGAPPPPKRRCHSHPRPPPTDVAAPTATVAHSAGWQQTILARPLFNPSRRPVGTASTQSGLPRLSAILIGPNEASAIFANGQKALVVVAGGAVSGDKVLSISATGVVLMTFAGPVTLRPRYAANAAAAAASATLPPMQAQPADSAITAGPYDNE